MVTGEMEERPIPPPGKAALPRPSREETRSAPKYITEWVVYVLEYRPFRLTWKCF